MGPSDLEKRRVWGGQVSKTGEQRMVLDLGDEALVGGALGITVQQMVQLRKDGERENAKPKEKHQPSGSAPAGAERLLLFDPSLH
jgi:hypothetical protein